MEYLPNPKAETSDLKTFVPSFLYREFSLNSMEKKGELSMEQREKTERELQAEEQVRQAHARLKRVKREEREKLRKAQEHHKYRLGGAVVKYFPEAYSFSELEMNRIIACAFSLDDIKNMIAKVINERTKAATKEEQDDESIFS